MVEVFFEFAYEVQIQIYNLLRNRHSEKFLAYLEVFFTKTKCKTIPTWDHCLQSNADKTNVIGVVDPAIQE